ncbi:unnamed protein product [Peniophora sp. CBMAI 1063]|nr:unnamed protein product [Peniophora sp. CBMAI 1063]
MANATPSPSSSGASNDKRKSYQVLGVHDKGKAPEIGASASTPELHVNGSPVRGPTARSTKSANSNASDEAAWGANFWVTLVDPQSGTSFFACPATGEVSWDAPVGNFVLPANENGEWWEIIDESTGVPYYYHTKSGETVWEKPEGFVIPLSVLQNTALGRRLSKSLSPADMEALSRVASQRSANGKPTKSTSRKSHQPGPARDSPPKHSTSTGSPPPKKYGRDHGVRRSLSSEQYRAPAGHQPTARSYSAGQGLTLNISQLPPIPASPYSTDASEASTPSSSKASLTRNESNRSRRSRNEHQDSNTPTRTKQPSAANAPSSYHPVRSPPQSLNAAAELFAQSRPSPTPSSSTGGDSGYFAVNGKDRDAPPSTPITVTAPATPIKVRMHGKEISGPVPNDAATMNLTPVKKRAEGKPILVERTADPAASIVSIRSGAHPILPENLSMDIHQFATSDFAKQYFATHRTGIIFKRTVPMEEMMAWQRAPLASPLLNIPRPLHRDAVKIFRVILRLMGDERGGRPVARMPDPTVSKTGRDLNELALFEEERWLLQMGLSHGELRDEIYCQVTKQLISNPSPESVFKGWQLLCILVITFPPSKNFESYLQSFLKQRTTHTEGRVDVMAKHCLKRLCIIAKRGPRGKPPTVAELETASDAAFNPSTFGESLDAVYRLQERNYPRQKIPIILPFLADGILALGGTKSEGIFRVPGDGDLVSDLKLRIDKGYYTLEGVDDPHVLASLLKLWLRELRDPLVPEEMYNDCIAYASEPDACVGVVERLPTINRRVVLFIISFLQLFLDEKVLAITKMTSANLALVMAPNLLRCNSESMAVVFTNAQYEQTFVHNLLLHLNCETIDPDYVPKHGLGAVTSASQPRTSKSRSRRPTHS